MKPQDAYVGDTDICTGSLDRVLKSGTDRQSPTPETQKQEQQSAAFFTAYELDGQLGQACITPYSSRSLKIPRDPSDWLVTILFKAPLRDSDQLHNDEGAMPT